ncbi:MAG: hypothetical protein L0Z62_44310 [Gemmataceae bacterium]|nr:hypothetical protein [Gemmataceae bacterium]
MNDPRPNPAFVEALLAQDKSVSEERYTVYRVALDRRIEAEASRRRALWVRLRPSKRGVLMLALGAAATVAALLVLRPWAATTPPAPPALPPEAEVVVLRLPPLAVACPSMGRFGHASCATVIALATIGQPLRHGDKELVRADVERFLKGALPGARAGACGFPHPDLLPEPYRQGTRVLLYLTGTPEMGWTVQHVEELEPGRERGRLEELEHFLSREKR